jgi:hypothetical protein
MHLDFDNKRSDDRVFILEEIKNYKPMKTKGLLDPQIFKGGNALHAVRGDDQLWFLRYENGKIPASLDQRFTKFSVCKDFVERYFSARGFTVKEVKD